MFLVASFAIAEECDSPLSGAQKSTDTPIGQLCAEDFFFYPPKYDMSLSEQGGTWSQTKSSGGNTCTISLTEAAVAERRDKRSGRYISVVLGEANYHIHPEGMEVSSRVDVDCDNGNCKSWYDVENTFYMFRQRDGSVDTPLNELKGFKVVCKTKRKNCGGYGADSCYGDDASKTLSLRQVNQMLTSFNVRMNR